MSCIGRYHREFYTVYIKSLTNLRSNTKIGIYLDAVYSSNACRSIIESTPAPNAITTLQSMDRDSTCQLSLAGDMICMLRDGLLQRPEVESMKGKVDTISLDVSPCNPYL